VTRIAVWPVVFSPERDVSIRSGRVGCRRPPRDRRGSGGARYDAELLPEWETDPPDCGFRCCTGGG
jgi:hypothetical protein